MTGKEYPDSAGMCGVNCALAPCYRTGTCRGCRSGNHDQKRVSKWRCRIRTCVLSKDLDHCGECGEFPCGIRKGLDVRYLEKHGIDLPASIRMLAETGPVPWNDCMQAAYTCPACRGAVDPYSRTCYECKKPMM